MSKVEETFNIGQVVLHYIHQENLWLEQKWVNRNNFSAGGTLRLQKLCRNKHFCAAGTISPNSKTKTFSCSPSIILFNQKLGLFKEVFVFPYLWFFPGSSVILLRSALLASQLGISNVVLLKSTQFPWHSLSAILKPVFKHEIRRQMSVYFETQQTVLQSTPMADFSFGFAEVSSLLLNGQKHLRSVPEDLISNKQKRTELVIKLSSQYFSTGHNFVWFSTRCVKINSTWWRCHRYSC